MNKLSQFVKKRRKSLGLTQEYLSFKAVAGLKFVRELQQGKQSLRMDKVNQVLTLFDHELNPIQSDRDEDVTNDMSWLNRCCINRKNIDIWKISVYTAIKSSIRQN